MKIKLLTLSIICIFGMALGAWIIRPSLDKEVNSKSVIVTDALKLEIVSNQPVAAVMHENSFTIKLTDRIGHPVERAEIDVHLRMPSMFCGSIPTTVEERTPGEYLVRGIPVMHGGWQAEVKLTALNHTLSASHPFIAK